MRGKDKLRKFRENLTFSNLIQPQTEEVLRKDHNLKGNWGKEIFGNANPIVLELGCGKGDYTIARAKRHPEKNYIGVDIKGARLWKGAKYATENQMKNVAFLRTRIEFIDSLFGRDEVSEIWLTFSDPQPHKPRKRLSSPLFLNRYRNFLKADGLMHLKTDSILLHEYTLETIASEGDELLFADNDIYNSGRDMESEVREVQTFYEQMFLAKGMPITYILWRLKAKETSASLK